MSTSIRLIVVYLTVLALGVADKSLGDTSDIVSDSSGVGTANSDTTNCSLSMPGTTVVCIENYTSGLPGHLRLCEGDIVEGKWCTLIHIEQTNLTTCGCNVYYSYRCHG